MIFTRQTQAFPPFRKKTCPSGATVQSSPRDLEISFPYQADGRFPGLRFPMMPPSQFLSGCVSAWHHQFAYSDGIAQASHLFPFYPPNKHNLACRGTGCFLLFSYNHYNFGIKLCQRTQTAKRRALHREMPFISVF